MSRHCPACDGRRLYGGEACPVCGPQHVHDPNHPSGFAAVWALLAAVVIVAYLFTL